MLIHKYFAFFFVFLILQSAYAYKANDQTAVMAFLPKNWTQRQISETANSINFELKNNNIHPPYHEMVLYSIIKKNSNDTAIENINNLYSGLNNGLKAHCKVSELKNISKPDLPFNQWVMNYQCDINNSMGLSVFIDADPVNMYLFSYQMSKSLFKQDMLKVLAEMIKICYQKNKESSCYHLISNTP